MPFYVQAFKDLAKKLKITLDQLLTPPYLQTVLDALPFHGAFSLAFIAAVCECGWLGCIVT
jgi:hypothetical protein